MFSGMLCVNLIIKYITSRLVSVLFSNYQLKILTEEILCRITNIPLYDLFIEGQKILTSQLISGIPMIRDADF